MPKTINRQPYTVETDIDIDTQFHSHSNWKGICDDKNYLNVDQETFEDCKNVYMSSDALLKSRPSFKCKNNASTSKYVKKWKFGDVIFALNEELKLIQLEPVYKEHNIVNPSIFQKEGIIFVFDTTSIKYYDMTENDLSDASDLLYSPERFIYTDGIKSEGEQLNLLTSKYKTIYNYTARDNIDPTVLPENVNDLIIGETNYGERKVPTDLNVLVDKYSEASQWSYDYNSGKPLISISNKGTAIRCDRYKSTNNYHIGLRTYTIYYSSDLITWQFIDMVYDALTVPKISEDGLLVYYIANNVLRVKSLVSINDVYEYPDWTPLVTLPEFPNYDEDYPYDVEDQIFRRAMASNVKMLNSKTYAAVYAIELDENATQPGDLNYDVYGYKHIYAYVVKDGNIVLNGKPTKYVYENRDQAMDTVNGNDTELNIYSDYIDFDFAFYENGDVTDVLAYIPILLKQYSGISETLSPLRSYLVTIAGYTEDIRCTVDAIDDGSTTREFSLDWSNLVIYGSTERVCSEWTPKFYFFNIDIVNDVKKLYLWDYFLQVDRDNTYKCLVSDFNSTSYRTGAISNNKLFITDDYYYVIDERIIDENISKTETLLHDNVIPISFINDTFYYIKNGIIYSNKFKNDTNITFVTESEGTISPILFEHNCELNEEYVSKGNDLYISKNTYDANGNFKLYFVEQDWETFNKPITNLYPVSENQVAIFFDDEIWYTEKTEQGRVYYKSKLQVGLKEGSDILTSQDGQNIIFSSTRGLVYMSYQELVQSTEQTLTYLSDSIYDRYKEFNKKPVKLFLNDFWLYCYHNDENLFYVFDVRNNSWWKWEYYYPILNILIIDDEPELLVDAPTNNSIKLDYSYNKYYDEIAVDVSPYIVTNDVDWSLTSQKLHLGTLNYTKNIASIIINNVETEDIGEDVSFNLSIKNYRTKISDRYSEPQNLLYKVNALRTYVKRCNSRKVNEFQYTISYDSENAKQLPLSIHSIIVKYTISGQVR